MSKATALWKLTIDPRGKTDPDADSLSFCRKQQIVGVGWGFEAAPSNKSEVRERYYAERGDRFSGALNILVSRMKEGDYAWVYGRGTYYLCKILSDWWYKDGGVWDAHDIHNARNAEWAEIPPHLIPGIVKRKLTMYGTAQLISEDIGWILYTDHLFEICRSDHVEQLRPRLDRIQERLHKSSPGRIFEILDEDDTEDLVGIYLQEAEGWRLIKSSTYRSQRDFECEMTRVRDGSPEVAVMQVKSGRTVTLYTESFRDVAETGTRVYLFSTAEPAYTGPEINNVVCLSMQDLEQFAISSLALLPLPTLVRIEAILDASERSVQQDNAADARTSRG